ncbi:DUF2635 domain-containing protein [Pseudomonas sp. xss_2]|uniref:DUF2635 domain-containing protein n=1 Tax=Pseudomonas sp. xss_2 TaxID=3367215 RepID=UPI00370BB11D
MKIMNLKPAPGRECPMPHNPRELLPAGGAAVPINAYWQRRVLDGDAVEQKASTKGSKAQ